MMTTTKCQPPIRSRRPRAHSAVTVKTEEQDIYKIDDAKCKMGTMDIKLDKDCTVILISRY
jgi:hypothetical protein